jgi:hypothetical protein
MFLQKAWFWNKKIFEISDTGLSVKDKSLLSHTDYFVEFDNLGSKRLRKKSGQIWWVIGSFFLISVSILLFIDLATGGDGEKFAPYFYLVLGLCSLIIFVLTYKQTFFLVKSDNSNAVEFLYNKPNKEEFEKFISDLISKRNSILDHKYGRLVTSLSYEQNYNNLIWLLNNDVINQVEFDNRLSNLDTLLKDNGNKIGFRNIENN